MVKKIIYLIFLLIFGNRLLNNILTKNIPLIVLDGIFFIIALLIFILSSTNKEETLE